MTGKAEWYELKVTMRRPASDTSPMPTEKEIIAALATLGFRLFDGVSFIQCGREGT